MIVPILLQATSFLVSGDETSQPTILPCDNKDVRAQTTTITKRFAGLVARYLLVLCFYCVTGIKFGDAEVCIRMFYDLIMRQYDFRPPPHEVNCNESWHSTRRVIALMRCNCVHCNGSTSR